MRRTLVTALAVFALFALTATSVLAANPNFPGKNNPSASVGSDGSLTVSFKSSGWGSGAMVDINLSAATAEVTMGCLTKKQNNEPGGLRTFVGAVNVSDTQPSGRNGTLTSSISALPPAAESFACPSHQQHPIVVSAIYTGVVLTLTDQDDPSKTVSANLGTVPAP